jgi:UDPglucose 6-dehydrogenase
MKIAVEGIWHLGSVTSICLASLGFKTLVYDDDKQIIDNFKNDVLPIFEPGLFDLFQKSKNNLTLTNNISDLKDVDLLWITYDTPIDDHDIANVDYVINKIKKSIKVIKNKSVILISSQLPVQTCNLIEKYIKRIKKDIDVCYSPENLRLGNAINVFLKPDRLIVGIRNQEAKKILNKVLIKITKNILWMSTESAEMTKHSINSFLALSVTFANEIASICEEVGANAKEVERGLKSESRIGERAYLGPGGPFFGGTLARDIKFLESLSLKSNLKNPIINSVSKSNNNHKFWYQKIINNKLKNKLFKKNILILGLTYKPNTDTLRRSQSLELIKWLNKNNIKNIDCYDPVIRKSTNCSVSHLNILDKITSLSKYDVIIISTPWNDFNQLFRVLEVTLKKNVIILDQNSLINPNTFSKKIIYFSVGYLNE